MISILDADSKNLQRAIPQTCPFITQTISFTYSFTYVPQHFKSFCWIGSIAIHLYLSHFHICNIIRVTMSLKYCNKILGVRTTPPQKCLIKIPHHRVSKHLLIIFQCNKLANRKVVAHVIQLNENEGL